MSISAGARAGGAAPFRAGALDAGDHQPRHDHADRHGDRPLRHGQRHLRPRDRLHARGGDRPHLARAGRVGSTERREEFIRRLRPDRRVRDMPIEFVDRNGRPFTLLISASVFGLEGAKYLVLNGRDITEKRRHAPGPRGRAGERLAGHRLHARGPLRAGQWRWRRCSAGSPARSSAGQAGRGCGRATRSTPRSAP